MTEQTKLPAMPFYVGDWRKDAAVQSLTYEERGIWFELLCFMWESEDRGKLVLNGRPMRDDEIAVLLGIPEAKWKQTRSKLGANGVAKTEQNGSKLISKRMVLDEAQRREDKRLSEIRAAAGRKGGQAKAKQNGSKSPSKPEASRARARSVSVSVSTKPEGLGETKPSAREEPTTPRALKGRAPSAPITHDAIEARELLSRQADWERAAAWAWFEAQTPEIQQTVEGDARNALSREWGEQRIPAQIVKGQMLVEITAAVPMDELEQYAPELPF